MAPSVIYAAAMPRALLVPGSVLLLAGPTALAFFSGGYFDRPRLAAALVVWILVLVVALVARPPLPTSTPGRLAVAGLAAITVWTAISFAWAPLAAAWQDSLGRLVLYLGALIASAALLRDRRVARALEPAFGLGAALVICEGLSDRLMPGVVTLDHSSRADGRLDQPITSWNAEGLLAAVGLVLCARVIGDRSRPAVLRLACAVACVPLGAGLYITFSRGALVAALLGVVILCAAAPTRSQLRGAAIAVGTAALAAIAAGGSGSVASLHGTLATRERQGAIVLAVLAVLVLVAGAVTLLAARRDLKDGEDRELPGARRLPAIAAVVAAIVVVGVVFASFQEKGSGDRLAAGATRLYSAKSNRHAYWRTGVNAFADHPLAGLGAGGFRVEWLKERTIDESVLDVHSLELEMASDLGLVGLLAFFAFAGGVAWAGRRAMRVRPDLAAGSAAALSAWFLHASIDWDWQLPAVTLPAIVMAGLLIAASEPEPPPPDPAA
jgi:O-antigen ligase